ncbi:helix-turn-helix domain-containing protein [Rhodobacter maris]|uniref:AraC-like DNA-binding protein n=1 Tax=Rhodobacter maris TaxID=446682 RepID=A0A285SPZ7_9RHOB|nr:AraC family transcriptional regulator [Rhodobacter maris]SOC08078.1 AraC-like DNA-binding protein [Rhodobacter maris]
MKLFSTPPLAPAAQQDPSVRPEAPARLRRASVTLLPEAPSAPRVVPLARLAQGGRWRVEAMRAHSEPCLLWFTRGQGRITLGGVTRGYGPHTAVFLPPGVMHAFEVGLQTHGMAVFFGRNTDLTLPHAAQHLRIRDTATQGEMTGLIDSAGRELDSGRPGAERAASHYLGLLSVALERQTAAQPEEARAAAGGRGRKLVARYTALLERDFRTGHGVADYAASLGVTATHLTRTCRANCGRAASELLQDRRLYEARRLLTETRTPVKDIAASLGFTSAAYFTRAFQTRTGKTPSAFRRGG